MLTYSLLTKRYHAWQYNRRKKPWRNVKYIHAALGRRNCALRLYLCCAAIAEFLVLSVKEPGIFGETVRLFDAVREENQIFEASDTDEDTYPPDRRGSGVTIDLKKGRVEFWKTDRTIHPSGEEKDTR